MLGVGTKQTKIKKMKIAQEEKLKFLKKKHSQSLNQELISYLIIKTFLFYHSLLYKI